jgi:hypothetical protein
MKSAEAVRRVTKVVRRQPRALAAAGVNPLMRFFPNPQFPRWPRAVPGAFPLFYELDDMRKCLIIKALQPSALFLRFSVDMVGIYAKLVGLW